MNQDLPQKALALITKHGGWQAALDYIDSLQALAGCAYQLAGYHDAPEIWLDRLSEASNGDALPDADTLADELLPYAPDVSLHLDAGRIEWLAANMRSIWDGRKREFRPERGDYRLPDIGLVESERTQCTPNDLRVAIDSAMRPEESDAG